MSSDILLVADYGRSGQGWLSYMLCYILNARFIEPYELLAGRQFTRSDHILQLTRGALPGRPKTSVSLIVKTHNHPAGEIELTDKVIYLVRDPRDVAVSAYYLNRRTRKWVTRSSVKAFIVHLLMRSRFASLLYTSYRWIRHYDAWRRTNCYVVRYENLLLDTQGVLRNIMQHFDLPYDDHTIEEAVELFSFKKITGRDNGIQDSGNSEFRKGIAGDFKNHYSHIQLHLYAHLFGNRIRPTGYNVLDEQER